MYLNFQLCISLLLLVIYAYTIVKAHILIARLDRREGVLREPETNLSFKFVKQFYVFEPEARQAALLLKINNYTVFVFFGLLAWWLFTQSPLI